MTPFASLPMYNFPEMRSVNAQFWGALRGLLLEAGLSDVPETLVFERAPVPARLEAEMMFSQTCGFPLETVFKGQALRLGAPVYDVPGCAGATHRAFFVVRADFPARRLEDLSRPSRNQTGISNALHPRSYGLFLDDLPIHIRPDLPAARVQT